MGGKGEHGASLRKPVEACEFFFLNDLEVAEGEGVL